MEEWRSLLKIQFPDDHKVILIQLLLSCSAVYFKSDEIYDESFSSSDFLRLSSGSLMIKNMLDRMLL